MITYPPFLKKGDAVEVIATAKTFDTDVLAKGIEVIQSWGLEVIKSDNLYKQNYQFAGTDLQRNNSLQKAIDRHNTKAIFCARGGYGTGRFIDNVNFDNLHSKPKWMIGFSDVTFLLAKAFKKEIASIHGPMVSQFADPIYKSSVEQLRTMLFGSKPNYDLIPNKLNKPGEAFATLIGGNLSIICSNLGTPTNFDFNNKILFIEEVSEHHYYIDRIIVQLKRAGILSKLKGIIVGHCSDMKDKAIDFGKSVEEIIIDATQEYHYPIIFNFPAGHSKPNLPLIIGAEVMMKVEKNKCMVEYTHFKSNQGYVS